MLSQLFVKGLENKQVYIFGNRFGIQHSQTKISSLTRAPGL